MTPSDAQRQALLVLALCPALAVSDTVVNALGLGVAAIIASTVTTIAAALLKPLPDNARWPIAILVLAAAISCIALFMNAWLHELHRSLGLFLPLVVANFVIQQRAQESTTLALPQAMLSGLRIGATMALVLLALGVAREIVGHGSLLHAAESAMPSLQLFRPDRGFLLAMLPPGAFISFGLLLAARNWLRRAKP